MHTVRTERLSTDCLLDIAMDAARGRGCPSGGADRYASLIRAVRAFALATKPRSRLAGVFGGVSVATSLDGIRIVVAMERGDARLTVSGPYGEAIAWSLDRIDATDAEARSMLSDAMLAWPRKAGVR